MSDTILPIATRIMLGHYDAELKEIIDMATERRLVFGTKNELLKSL